jgi:hypothetical protein
MDLIMKKTLTTLQRAIALSLFATVFFASYATAQGIIPPDEPGDLPDLPLSFNVDTDAIDWDGFTMFPFEGAGLVRIENPDKSGINTTNHVIEYKKGGAGEGGQPWAGFFYHTDGAMEFSENATFRLKVWSPRAGIKAMLKLEMRQFSDVNTGDLFTDITVANGWNQLEWNLSAVDRDTPYDRIVIIMDLQGTAGDAGDNFTWYLDDFEFDSGIPTSIDELGGEIPANVQLAQNFPNPFNPTTNIQFSLPQSAHATLEVFDMLGQTVSVLVNQTLSAGEHTATFDASNLSSGIYIYRLQVGGEVITRKLSLVK